MFDSIFHPRSLAIVGASGDTGKLSHALVQGFREFGYPGNLYLVNPSSSGTILDLPVYQKIADIPDDVAVAIIITPPPTLPALMKECAAKGVQGIILFTAPSLDLQPDQAAVIKEVKACGTRLIGPNSMGIYCPTSGLTIFPGLQRQSGSVSLITHSGAMAFIFIAALSEMGLGCNKAVSCGNEWDLDWTDFLEYLGQDEETEMIAGYLEGVRDGTRFLNIARTITPHKPIFLIKGGDSTTGRLFVSSHTGSLAGSHSLWESALRQANVIRVADLHDAIDHLVMFRHLMNKPLGRRVGVVTGTGGPTVTTLDLCEARHLQIPELSPQARKELNHLLPPYGSSCRNPVDLSIAASVDPSLYTHAISILDQGNDVDVIICIHAGDWQGEELAERLVHLDHTLRKPLVVMMMGATEKNARAIRILNKAGIPAFPGQRNIVEPLAALIRWKEKAERGNQQV